MFRNLKFHGGVYSVLFGLHSIYSTVQDIVFRIEIRGLHICINISFNVLSHMAVYFRVEEIPYIIPLYIYISLRCVYTVIVCIWNEEFAYTMQGVCYCAVCRILNRRAGQNGNKGNIKEAASRASEVLYRRQR